MRTVFNMDLAWQFHRGDLPEDMAVITATRHLMLLARRVREPAERRKNMLTANGDV